MAEEEIGKVMDFFARPVVAGIDLTASVSVGDKIHIKGANTDMDLTVSSMQIDNVDVQEAKSRRCDRYKGPRPSKTRG